MPDNPTTECNIVSALSAAAATLRTANVETPLLDSQLLLAWVIKGRREDLAREPERVLTKREEIVFDKAVQLRSQRRPIPYITGEASFYGREFKINRGVLIPRPETELQVEIVRDFASHFEPNAPIRVADIGTGSGCIAVSIACELPAASVVATDISRLALLLAAKNVRRHGVADRVQLRHGDLCGPLYPAEEFDIIVSNPPYIDLSEAASLMPEVRDYEPAWALYGVESADGAAVNEHGLPRRIRRRLMEQAQPHLKPGGLLAVEIGLGQAKDAVSDAAEIGYRELAIVEDHAGIPRILTGIAS